jgi:hypothetical protein
VIYKKIDANLFNLWRNPMSNKIVAPNGKFLVQCLVEDDGEFYIGGAPIVKDDLESARKYADEEKIADAKKEQRDPFSDATPDCICFAVYDDKGENVYTTDFTLGLK